MPPQELHGGRSREHATAHERVCAAIRRSAARGIIASRRGGDRPRSGVLPGVSRWVRAPGLAAGPARLSANVGRRDVYLSQAGKLSELHLSAFGLPLQPAATSLSRPVLAVAHLHRLPLSARPMGCLRAVTASGGPRSSDPRLSAGTANIVPAPTRCHNTRQRDRCSGQARLVRNRGRPPSSADRWIGRRAMRSPSVYKAEKQPPRSKNKDL